jgi:hypothetical protein
MTTRKNLAKLNQTYLAHGNGTPAEIKNFFRALSFEADFYDCD